MFARITGIAGLLISLAALPACAVKIADLAHLQGERENTLVGYGLVFGLKGTGDGGQYLPAMRSLQALLEKMQNHTTIPDLGPAANVAIVMVTAKLPPGGYSIGDKIDVRVSSAGAASNLRGGWLFPSPLYAPNPAALKEAPTAMADGDVELNDPSTPTGGVVREGGKLDSEYKVEVVDRSGHMRLQLEENSAHRVTASTIAKIINDAEGNGEQIAVADNGRTVVVAVPQNEQTRPNDFIARILQLPVRILPTEARVVVNRKRGTIVITGDVEISPTVITHNGLSIQTVAPPPVPTARNPITNERRALSLDTTGTGGARLKDLVEALDAIKVPTDDRITILEMLDRSGHLHAKIIHAD